jgi:crotonobetainyl-CoA:carnitine CoA-transferase CaiB-like acyl-CoA transferase
MEQALSLPYATLRFVHLGWRVIRIEPTPSKGRKSKGDPNRYIGRQVAGEDRHSYYVAPNVGKEAIAINLKTDEGQQALYRILQELKADIFCTNTLPAHHKTLGIDAPTIHEKYPEMIWGSISAMGTAYADVPGYDPATQALCGYMDLTGDRDGPPMQCGPPLLDLKAGDELFTQALHAMWQREHGASKQIIDISMAQCAVSWLNTFLPMLEMGSPPEEIRRHGNRHRQFIPVDAFPTSDGFIYIAIGSDVQWTRFTETPMFGPLARDNWMSNEGRRETQAELHASIGQITAKNVSRDIAKVLQNAGIPHSPITPIEQVADLEFVKNNALKTVAPDGKEIRLPPPAVMTEHLESTNREIPFAPSYGQQSDSVLLEAGMSEPEIAELRAKGVVA